MNIDFPDYDTDPIEHCKTALKYGDAMERFIAADILRGLAADAQSALPMIIEAMQNDTDNQVRTQCVFALVDIGYALKQKAVAAVPPLIKLMLSEENAEIRSLAACALGAIQTSAQDLLPALRQASIKDKNEDVRQAAHEALSKFNDNNLIKST